MILLLLAACFDLPPDWEHAQRITDFTQRDCSGSAYGGDTGGPAPATLDAVSSDGAVTLTVGPVGFRCAQDVEGFWVADGDEINILVQPVEMNPTMVAACDCLYDLDMTVPSAGASVVVYTRGDHQSGRDSAAVQAEGDVLTDVIPE